MDPADLRDIAPTMLPGRLAQLHNTCRSADQIKAWLPLPTAVDGQFLDDILVGAGFSIRRRDTIRPATLHRQWTLPDTVGPGMRLLVSGLNPSPAAADDGVGFARPGNRFWPAAIGAQLLTRDRDANHALQTHRVGMTDIVKRTTRRADELSSHEYQAGLERLGRMVAWLKPKAVCFVGLAGWRAAVERRASPGWQHTKLGGSPVYLMPSTSGLNASSQLPDLTEHLVVCARGSA